MLGTVLPFVMTAAIMSIIIIVVFEIVARRYPRA
jgi:hypothetical protein